MTETSRQPELLEGICPDARGPVVFRDTLGRWRGRYRDESPDTHDVVVSGYSGEQARDSFAKYLGVDQRHVRIFEATGRIY